jgi:hypothetical protein
VSSGGTIEPVLVAAFTDGAYDRWGSALHHLHGASLIFDGPTCVDLTMHHMDKPTQT